ncbi:MAG: hypothetical protein ACHQX3_00020 [Nitrospirales bacterium]
MIDPKTGRETGVWFTDPAWMAYRGDMPIVMDLENQLDPNEPKVRVFHVSRCPSCEGSRFQNKICKRWLILPP